LVGYNSFARALTTCQSCSIQRSRDFSLGLAHTNSNLNKGVGDGLVVAQLHEFWSHWDAKLLGHTLNFVGVWLSAEGRGHSFKRLLGVHQTLELSSWVVAANVVLVLSLLLSSLLVSSSY